MCVCVSICLHTCVSFFCIVRPHPATSICLRVRACVCVRVRTCVRRCVSFRSSPPREHASLYRRPCIDTQAHCFTGGPGAPGLAGAMWHDVLFPPRFTCVWLYCTCTAGTGRPSLPCCTLGGAGALALACDGFMDGHTPSWFGSFALGVHR